MRVLVPVVFELLSWWMMVIDVWCLCSELMFDMWWYILYYYYYTYIIIILHYILSYTILSSSSSPFSQSSFPLSFYLLFPFPILCSLLFPFPSSYLLIHSIRVGSWVCLFMLDRVGCFDPACFIGWECRVVQF